MNQVSAAAFLLSCFLGMVSSLLSNDFSECKEFFYRGIVPQGITGKEYQPICQQYQQKNSFRFATLYDTNHYVALYSAYKVKLSSQKHEVVWMFEPQLNDRKLNPEMQPLEEKDQFDNQTTLLDYKGSIYTKGHLAPKQHLATKEDKEATYTLTNIVPQREGSNAGTWEELEKKIMKRKISCTGNMYVITGTIPFEADPKIPSVIKVMNKKVIVPEYLWSAYCCTDYKNNLKENEKQFFPTFAAVGRNYPDSGDDIVPKNPHLTGIGKGYDVMEMPLKDLEAILEDKLKMKINLFHQSCS